MRGPLGLKQTNGAGLVSYFDVYIGFLDDSTFFWDGGNWQGNVPAMRSPFFPRGELQPFLEVVRRIDAGQYEGKRTDWGGWVAKVSKAQILTLLDELYTAEWFKVAADLKNFCVELDDTRLYALVAAET